MARQQEDFRNLHCEFFKLRESTMPGSSLEVTVNSLVKTAKIDFRKQ